VKIVHRLPALDDREAVGATMNLTPAQSQYLVTLPPGEAAVHADGMDYPLLARMPDGRAREAGGPAALASAGAVSTPRSVTCGTACQAEPCTLGQMRAAQLAGVVDPRITLWAELTVLAHLTGYDLPRPGLEFFAALRALDGRLRECALAHAVDEAVAARMPAISSSISPDPLAAHVTAVMHQAIAADTRGCGDEEPQLLAPPYKWAVVRDELLIASREPGAGRHPLSEAWERAYGRPIPGDTAEDQLNAVNGWYMRDQCDILLIGTTLWGSRPRSALERAVGVRPDSGNWNAALHVALKPFINLDWPLRLLSRPAQRANDDSGGSW
jgi:hypothetical protein